MSNKIDITPKKDGGVLKVIKKEGNGVVKPTTGTTVKVHYVGTLENGTKFDSSRDRGDQFTFNLGRGNVIKGWDLGVATMTKGEVAEFTIRSDYGYGDAGSPPKIPGKATLIFEVELFDWSAEDISPDRDGTILRTVIVEGSKNSFPNDTSKVVAHCVGTYQGTEFYNREVTFHIGEGSEEGLPEGVERALRRFQHGEKSKIEIRGHKYTYGNNPPAGSNIPINAPLEFTIFLKEFEKVPATWEMTAEEKLEAASQAKERGTMYLKKGNYKLAYNKYKRAEEVLEYEKSTDPEKIKERDAILNGAYLNLSLVCSKQNENLECIKWCDKVLETKPDNVKALYRKANALLTMGEVRDAIKLFEKIVNVEPDNKAAAQQIITCKNTIREQNEKDKKRFKNLFSKISSYNDDDKPTNTVEDEDEIVASTSGSSTSNA
ncbi:CBN-FKB-6 protein [Caenorhabditis brenneri]|uniref:peptidylprolyl isomerase n=1 Tax=Caenorhabditis brenneri TaxID=135651 RepID=G0NKP6_CAEBE|nr:CBN-FKB-6 protein [Caenorhabditis brenneri]